MKYAQIDDDGLPVAFFDKSLHGEAIPKDAIEISDWDRDWETKRGVSP